MSEVARFRRLFEYDAWANTAALTSLRLGPAPEKARWIGARMVLLRDGSFSLNYDFPQQ